jgi:recombination protein RecA
LARLNKAKKLSAIVEKSGAWYAYGGDKIAQGREAAKKYLDANPKVLAEIAAKVRKAEAEKE